METEKTPVVYIVTKLELGGAQKVCLSLFKELSSTGSETYLITGTEGPLVKDVKNLKNAYLLPSLKRELGLASIWYDTKTFIAITKILTQLKNKHPDLIVHTHSSKAGFLGRLAAYISGIKTRIHTVHGFPFHANQSMLGWTLAYLCEYLCAFFTTHYICVSQSDCTTGEKYLPGFEQKQVLIRAAVDTRHFFVPAIQTRPFPDMHEPFVFGTISCLKPQKNLIDMLKAFAHMHEKNRMARLEIIGDGPQRESLEDWVRSQHLENAITFHGWQHEVKPFLKKWHCFVLSSLWEGLPCALIEARTAKLPIITYDTGGISEVIVHGTNGLIVPQGDWQTLSKNMLLISTDELLFMTLRSYPDNLKDYDVSTMIQAHRALYQKVKDLE